MGVHRKKKLVFKKRFSVYISMGVHRYENLILKKFKTYLFFLHHIFV